MSDGCRKYAADRPVLAVAAALCVTLTLSGCAARTATPPTAPVPSARIARRVIPHPPSTPLFVRLETARRLSDELVSRGAVALAAGDRNRARERFDEALRLVLDGPEPVPSGQVAALVDRISTLEVSAHAGGEAQAANGRSAAVDARLATTTFARPSSGADAASVAPELPVLPDVPIPMNGRVRSAIAALTGRRHDVVAEGLKRAGRYLPMIRDVLARQGVPAEVAFLPLVESSYKPLALSRARAHGMWQFVRGTARANGLKQDWYIDERLDPEKATVAAARYLRMLYTQFDGDWQLALAAYNAGPGRVQRAIRRAGTRDFWAISRTGRYLPRETRNYVPLALAAMLVGRYPARYGFDLTPDPPLAYAKVSVPHAIDLTRLSEWSGTSPEVIRLLNPELRRWMTPFDYPEYQLKVPAAAAGALERRVAAAVPTDLITPQWHVVQPGESLWRIARVMKLTRVELAAANRLSPSAKLRIGQRLLIPGGPDAPASARVVPRAPAVPRPAAPGGPTRAGRQTYFVRAGDTLFGIARLFRTTVDALKRWNRLRSNLIRPGDRLTVLPR